MFRKKTNIHFVGIGGIGMSGIAELLINLGHQVSGSDLKESEATRRLVGLGANIRIGHDALNIVEADVIVVSSAVSASNVEVEAAVRQFIPVIPRAEMLAELMRLKFSVAVAGSHGKTTTTSLVGTILGVAGLDPTMVIGGLLGSIGSNAVLGGGEILVAEADESDGSFLMLTPTFAVVTNIDLEHLDYYRDLDHLKNTFLEFLNKVPFYGSSIICLDDMNVQSLIPRIKKRYLTYGLSAQADIQAIDLIDKTWGSRFELVVKGEKLGPVEINLPGKHSVLNALAAAGVAFELDVPAETIVKGLNQVVHIQRRLQFKGEAGGIVIIDDYGHHPTEIRATLAALKTSYPDRRLLVLFQPHRFSRTQALMEVFATSFNQADRLIITDIYPAGEQPIPGVTGEKLAEKVRLYGHHDAVFEPKVGRIAERAMTEAESGDVILTLGAGNIWRAGEALLELLRHEYGDRK